MCVFFFFFCGLRTQSHVLGNIVDALLCIKDYINLSVHAGGVCEASEGVQTAHGKLFSLKCLLDVKGPEEIMCDERNLF